MAQEIGKKIESDFLTELNRWHASREVYDVELDAQIHQWYADCYQDVARKEYLLRGIPFFSPSSVNDCPRALYERLRGAKRDRYGQQPHQGRWTRIGTAVGDMLQRDLLFMEKHREIPFHFERNEWGEPMFEEFAKTRYDIVHHLKPLSLFGACDGILQYRTETGTIRVGLEIKSKQTTPAKTSAYSLQSPTESHLKQCLAYSIMYNVDHYLIVYVNAAKSKWEMTEEEYAKTPDIRVFHNYFTEEDKQNLLDELVGVIRAAEDGNPPPLNPEKWAFNNFKRAVAVSLSEEEIDTLERLAHRVQRSTLPVAKKNAIVGCYRDVKKIREESV